MRLTGGVAVTSSYFCLPSRQERSPGGDHGTAPNLPVSPHPPKIFTKQTQGKYNKVVLSKDMVPSAQEAGEILPHEAAVLSQGTADQLYLAVRLAICQLVLPGDDPAPILLDDALVTFDDDRMAAALDYLVELAKDRQILLFTCQRRELDYLARTHPGAYHGSRLTQ